MKSITLTKQQARRFLLIHQGLLPPYGFEGKEGILLFLRRVGCIQFDPLDIVGHNSELVLQSRVNRFRPSMLEELLYKDRKLIDGWDKMMAIYPIEDWSYLRYRQREAAGRSQRRDSELVKEASREIFKIIEERGPLSSIDLEHDRKVDWPWGPTRLAKAALDNMYFTGELVIHSKVHTRKVYDLASRHIPIEILSTPDPNSTQQQYYDWHVLRRLGSVGLLWNKGGVWHGVYGVNRKERADVLERLVQQGKAVELNVEGIKLPLYVRSQDMPELEKAQEMEVPEPRAAILAPLDNLLWARELVAQLFDFDYTWEVYKPVAERKYGYYVLPVLYGDCFIARFEPGKDKNTGNLIIKNWWWESDVEKTPEMCDSLKNCFKRFIGYKR